MRNELQSLRNMPRLIKGNELKWRGDALKTGKMGAEIDPIVGGDVVKMVKWAIQLAEENVALLKKILELNKRPYLLEL